jgi:HAD superfamily hydrolase (TIGR01509 family)
VNAGALELVIFDCDGVLVDSEKIGVRLEAVMLAELGWPLSEREIVERFVGRPETYMLGEVEAHLGSALPDGWLETFHGRYRAAFEAELEAVAGVADALDLLDVASCVASSGTHERIRLSLGLTGLLDRFEGRIFSADDVAHGKPAPDLFLHAAASCGAAPENCVVVEDSLWGVEAARAAGMPALAYVGGGLTAPERFAGPGTVTFDDMRRLPSLLRSRTHHEGVRPRRDN